MSKKLIVINIGGSEYVGEEPRLWPPEKGEFTLCDPMLIKHEMIVSPSGPLRLFVLHPLNTYTIKRFDGWRLVTKNEHDAYVGEQEATRLVKTVPAGAMPALTSLVK